MKDNRKQFQKAWARAVRRLSGFNGKVIRIALATLAGGSVLGALVLKGMKKEK